MLDFISSEMDLKNDRVKLKPHSIHLVKGTTMGVVLP